jgi:putative transposase
VRNLVNEVHKKVANDLCSKYDTILLPVFETQRMVRKPKNNEDKQRTISSKTARGLLGWKHFGFRNYLASKVIMAGKELMVVTEEYTTQCCGSCGALNKMGAAKVYECGECGFVCGRDENAARNIFLKYLKG